MRIHLSRTFTLSILTSLLTTVLDFAVLTTAVEVFKINYVVATWIGTVVGSISNFTINKHWAFKHSPNLLGPQLTRFVLVQAAASGWHTLGVWLLTRFVGTPYQVSKLIVAAAVGLGWNYPMNRSLVFSTAGLPEEASSRSSRSSPRPLP